MHYAQTCIIALTCMVTLPHRQRNKLKNEREVVVK